MRIQSIRANDAQQVFVLRTWRGSYSFPYGKAKPVPSRSNPIVDLHVDEELGGQGFTYHLSTGDEGTVLLDQVLEFNQDPAYLRNMLLYKLTLEAQKRLETTTLSRREIIRRLGTSPAQFYRLIDQTNYSKSVDKVLALLQVLGCDIELIVRSCDNQKSDRMASPA